MSSERAFNERRAAGQERLRAALAEKEAVEMKVAQAFQAWQEAVDPPPIGITVGEWIRIVKQYWPDETGPTAKQLNLIGRREWGGGWYELTDDTEGEF
jgi:hypothetical protein